MSPLLQVDPVPLREEEGGVFRVGESRVSLDTVIHEYKEGADPEGIVNHYPTLHLADVYAVIAYYLRHEDEVEEYLSKRQAEAAQLRQEIESRQPGGQGLLAKLKARRDQQGPNHAPARS